MTRSATALLLLALLALACSEAPTRPPRPPAEKVSFAVHCSGDVESGELRCDPSESGGQAGAAVRRHGGEGLRASALIVGGQGTYVQLTNDPPVYDGTTDIFSADVYVRNLILQALGTPDGTTVGGVRFFVETGPAATDGSGANVTVANADGTGTFDGTNAPYFEWNQILQALARSGASHWEFDMDGATSFEFTGYIDAEVQYPDGWVQPYPVEVGVEVGSDVGAVGKALLWYGDTASARTLTFTSDDPSLASVASVGDTVVVTGVSEGDATITIHSDGPEADGSLLVHVVPATSDAALEPALQVAVGEAHSCVLNGSGQALCWGHNEFGQLGDGSIAQAEQPVQVLGGHTFTEIDAGGDVTCGLATDGTVYCWGQDTDPDAGLFRQARTLPEPVSTTITFSSLDVGWGHACGMGTGGQAYCWGRNDLGQLGDGTMSYSASPVAVSGPSLVSVHAGLNHSCGLASGGDAYCWGGNTFGELGNGDATRSSQLTPVLVSGGHTWASIEPGGVYTCGIDDGGDAYCWGNDLSGQLGDGSPASGTLNPSLVSGSLSHDLLAASDENSIILHTCSLDPSGAASCWGSDQWGQVGAVTTETCTFNSTFDCTLVPLSVDGGLSFREVDLGLGHTCGVATTGLIYCWGLNDNGQLGDGTRTSRDAPTRVTDPLAAAAQAARRADGVLLRPRIRTTVVKDPTSIVPEIRATKDAPGGSP